MLSEEDLTVTKVDINKTAQDTMYRAYAPLMSQYHNIEKRCTDSGYPIAQEFSLASPQHYENILTYVRDHMLPTIPLAERGDYLNGEDIACSFNLIDEPTGLVRGNFVLVPKRDTDPQTRIGLIMDDGDDSEWEDEEDDLLNDPMVVGELMKAQKRLRAKAKKKKLMKDIEEMYGTENTDDLNEEFLSFNPDAYQDPDETTEYFEEILDACKQPGSSKIVEGPNEKTDALALLLAMLSPDKNVARAARTPDKIKCYCGALAYKGRRCFEHLDKETAK
jgi:hypothetical protein